MKKELSNFNKISARWFKIQFSAGIDKDYVAKNIIHKYVNLKSLKEQKVPFYEYVDNIYHYYKLGKWDKIDEIFIKIISEYTNSKKNVIENKSQVLLEVKKYDKPPILKKKNTVNYQKELNDTEVIIKLIKYYILIATSFDRIVTNNRLEYERVFFQDIYYKALEKIKLKGINEAKLIDGALKQIGNPKQEIFTNKFNPKSNLKEAIAFFSVFKSPNEENFEKPWLTEEQFSKFIERAFCQNKSIPKQKLTTGNKEDAFIIKRFAEYFDKEKSLKHCAPKDKSKYVELLTGNFVDWDFDKVSINFTSVRSKRNWEFYK